MAVTVQLKSGLEYRHPDGKFLVVTDGHLEVQADEDGYTPTIAYYAPGFWISGVVERAGDAR